MLRNTAAAILLVLAGTSGPAAQEFQVRTYSVTPVGMNLAARVTLQQNLRLTAVITYPLTRKSGVSLALSSGRNAGRGSDFDGLALAYQTAF